ncbi:IS110 family transposase [Paraglaciecola sp. 25GB23A]|uniref:IS110 family transposase n=1 Tax=Paraglaciecola sp. 25GB23A TaxID=3156068 RepID=UPI0032AF9417
MYRTKVGVDLAKHIIQVCILNGKKVVSNVEMSTDEFLCWLVKTKPVTIAFEACSTSNYWYQQAIKAGHDARLVNAKLVKAVRQNQKTDKNDALAIVQTLFLPEMSFITGKNIEQQQLQSIQRLRELALKHQGAAQKQIVSLLLELNIRVPNAQASLLSKLEDMLEDAENDLPVIFRATLGVAKNQLENMINTIREYDKYLEKTIHSLPDCKKLLKLEGVGPINAVNLYIALSGEQSQPFKKGKDASACIGLTPIQYSSGGKTNIGTIGKHCKNTFLRSQLIAGAMAVVIKVLRYGAKTKKELWLKGLMERRGNKCAAVALANKTVRTAYAMLSQNTEYHAA